MYNSNFKLKLNKYVSVKLLVNIILIKLSLKCKYIIYKKTIIINTVIFYTMLVK